MKNCNNYGGRAKLLTQRGGGTLSVIVSGSPNGVKEQVESERSSEKQQ